MFYRLAVGGEGGFMGHQLHDTTGSVVLQLGGPTTSRTSKISMLTTGRNMHSPPTPLGAPLTWRRITLNLTIRIQEPDVVMCEENLRAIMEPATKSELDGWRTPPM